ncbi:MAG: MATE family efflux transporter [Defluviitaleaceae bacterium]|nr:MATE family efflux transporter [Defluviitaleaceae bacterium]
MSAKKTKYDLTQGPILHKLIALSLPIMATSFMQMAYSLTDMFWMGRLAGGPAVAAVGTAAQFLWLSMAIMVIGRMGAEIGVSQNMGKGDIAAAKSFAQNAFIIAIVLGTAYAAVLIVLSGPLIGFFRIDDPQVVHEARQYLMVSALSIPFLMAHNVITGCYNGFGNTKIPFYINSFGLVLNIVISPILIFVMGLGIVGAAAGTVVASVVNLAIKIWAIKFYSGRPFDDYTVFSRIDWGRVRQICKWGLPVAAESALFTMLFMVVSRLVSEFGVGAIAAHRVGYNVEALSFMVGGGFAMAFASFTGQNYGAKKWSRLFSGSRISLIVMAGYGVFVTFVLFVFANPLVRIFLDCPYEIQMGGDYLRIVALTQLLFCMEGVAVGSFRGRGLTVYPSVVSISSNVLRVIVTYALAATALGINGVWAGIAISMTFKSLWLLAWFWFNGRKLPREDAPPVCDAVPAD